MRNRNTKAYFLLFLMTCPLFLISCGQKKIKPIIIWTNQREFASYVELFNKTHSDAKAIVVYKEAPANSLPPAKDETVPDILVGSWLKNSKTRKNFRSIDYLWSQGNLSKTEFYTNILNYGVINDQQYLLPVSFNLPMMVFSKKNEMLVTEEHNLTIEDIKMIAGAFNLTTKKGAITSMGYAPSWDGEFLYLCAKLNGADFMEKGNSFTWNNTNMNRTLEQLKDWTKSRNLSTSVEQNFQFKYLYMSPDHQVTQGHSLFAFMKSSDYFTLPDASTESLTFRWISGENSIPVNESIVTMGIYRKSKNADAAEKFITWFFDEKTQQSLLERSTSMDLDSKNFGISGGFSAFRPVTEKIYPTYYQQLMSNLPDPNLITTPKILPAQWQNMKDQIIIPYLQDSTDTDNEKNVRTLEERISDYEKQY